MKTQQKLHRKLSKNSSHSHHNSFSYQKTKKQNFSSYIFENARNSLCCGSPKVGNSTKLIGNNDKYKSYIQFMQSGKISPNELAKRNSFAFQKRKTVTPTPRRNSLHNTERKRLSVLSTNINNHQHTISNIHTNSLKNYQPVSMISRPKSHDMNQRYSQPKSPSMLTKKVHIKNDLCVKGKIAINSSRQQANKKKSKSKKLLDCQKFKIQGKKVNRKAQRPFIKKQNNKRTINLRQQSARSTIQADQKMELQQQNLLAKLFKGIQFHRDLGKGAHALVKSAVDWNNNRKIAVKVYSKQLLKDDDLKGIQRQVQILMSLQHQNVVRLYEIVQSYKTINLIMQYGGGNSLDQFIRSKNQQRLKQQQAHRIFVQVLNAVTYLERMNIVHRDLKPENILLNKHLDVKIIDFGFSLICARVSEISSYCGTPTYMAPEVVSKTPHNPHLSDRWSLGILLYTMLNGCTPFKAATQKQLFEKIRLGEFFYLSNVCDTAKQLINKFLCKQPSQRISAEDALQSEWVLKLNNLPN